MTDIGALVRDSLNDYNRRYVAAVIGAAEQSTSDEIRRLQNLVKDQEEQIRRLKTRLEHYLDCADCGEEREIEPCENCRRMEAKNDPPDREMWESER